MKKRFYAIVLSSVLTLTACSAAETSDTGQYSTDHKKTEASQEVVTTENETEQSKTQTESSADNTGAADEEPQMISVQELDDHFKIGTKTGKIVLEAYDDGSYLLKVMDGAEVLGEIEMNTAHPGNKEIYLSLNAEQPYLVVCTPYVMQGDADLSYEVLTWQEGTQEIKAKDSIQFRYALYTDADMPVTEIAEYAVKLSDYLENSRLLVSVDTTGVKTEETDADSYSLFNRLLPIADKAIYEELELDQLDSIEKKLVRLNEYFKETYLQYRSSEE